VNPNLKHKHKLRETSVEVQSSGNSLDVSPNVQLLSSTRHVSLGASIHLGALLITSPGAGNKGLLAVRSCWLVRGEPLKGYRSKQMPLVHPLHGCT